MEFCRGLFFSKEGVECTGLSVVICVYSVKKIYGIWDTGYGITLKSFELEG